MENGFEDVQFENCVTRYTQNVPIFLSFSFLKKRKSPTLFTSCILINKDNHSIQQKYSFIQDVKLNKSGNVSESPPIGYGDCATHLQANILCSFLS